MANTATGWTTFVTKTIISSSAMNTNLASLKENGPLWQKYTIAYTDINTASSSFTGTLYNLDPKEIPEIIIAKHSTAFVGGSISKVDIQVASGTYQGMGQFNMFQTVAESAYNIESNPVVPSFSATTVVYYTVSSTGANLDSLTAGTIDIWVKKALLP